MLALHLLAAVDSSWECLVSGRTRANWYQRGTWSYYIIQARLVLRTFIPRASIPVESGPDIEAIQSHYCGRQLVPDTAMAILSTQRHLGTMLPRPTVS